MKKDDCIFCKLANGIIPTNTLFEDDDVRVIFDLSPASKGHVIALPKEHYADIYELDPEVGGRIFKTVTKLAPKLADAVGCEGMNILQNNGEVAGQTVFHFHIHMIPRQSGDDVRMTWKQGELDASIVPDIVAKVNA